MASKILANGLGHLGGPLPEVRILLFDVFGTVVDWRTSVAREAASFLDAIGRRDIDPGDFADAWRGFYQPAMEAIRNGARSFERLDVLHRENLDLVLKRFAIDVSEALLPSIDDLNRAWHRLDPWPDSVPGLRRLKESFTIAPLSNGNLALMTNMSKRAGLPWDVILGAEVARAYKPAPEAYLRTVEIAGYRPEQACMVAAHEGDLAAAAACGLRTAFVERPLEFGPASKPLIRTGDRWDVDVADFMALADALAVPAVFGAESSSP